MASEAAADVDDVDAQASAEIEDLDMKRSGRKMKENVRAPLTVAWCVCPTTFVLLGHSGPPELDADTVFQCAQVSVFACPRWT